MADNNSNQGQLVLAQNQYAYIQDQTKGHVQVYGGPVSVPMSQSDKPVLYNITTGGFDYVNVTSAVRQNAFAREGDYIVLENPAFGKEGNLNHPRQSSNTAVDLEIGKKIVVPGPTNFALWPGQIAESIKGHHLRSNQYLIVRVYNEAQANVSSVDSSISEDLDAKTKFVNGQLFVIKGTESPFYIPTTGFEVVKEGNEYVREALTLERLEYCILLDENGSKRYEKGPQVVFPKATEKFIRKGEGNGQTALKFKAIELNDQMGLYVKVIADYEEEVAQVGSLTIEKRLEKHEAGEELFITGKQQRIYYPRPEHALIEYKDPDSTFMRQRYYSIAIPTGEGRYVLDKNNGSISTEKGYKMFLPDPRNQTIVRRVLDKNTVGLWYPGNQEALAYNATLRSLNADGGNYIAEATLLGSVDAIGNRGINRGTSYSKGISAPSTSDSGNDRVARSGTFTPPPALTLNTKYDGVPCINIWTGYAVQVVKKDGTRRIVLGPTSILLDYDETLEVLSLSTGKPKNTDNILRDVYLRYENNVVSDIVSIVTKDNVEMSLKVSYNVNFLEEFKDKWFSVENYVKFLTDRTRSLIKASAKNFEIKEINDKASVIFRDTVLGPKDKDKVRTRLFPENGMVITDMEVFEVQIKDAKISQLLKNSQQQTVETTIALAAEEHNLTLTKRQTEVKAAIAKLHSDLVISTENLRQEEAKVKSESELLILAAEADRQKLTAEVELAKATSKSDAAAILLATLTAADDHTLQVEQSRASIANTKVAAITPNLIEAMLTLGQTEMTTKLAEAVAPLAIHEQLGIGATGEKLFAGTPLAGLFANMDNRPVSRVKAQALPLPK